MSDVDIYLDIEDRCLFVHIYPQLCKENEEHRFVVRSQDTLKIVEENGVWKAPILNTSNLWS